MRVLVPGAPRPLKRTTDGQVVRAKTNWYDEILVRTEFLTYTQLSPNNLTGLQPSEVVYASRSWFEEFKVFPGVEIAIQPNISGMILGSTQL